MDLPTDDPSPVDWVRELRRHHEGTLVIGDRATTVRFIIDGASGTLVLPVDGWMLEHPTGVLFLPEEREGALQVLLEFLPGEPPGAAQDRWCAYHAETRQRLWATARICGTRRATEVCEADDLPLLNPLQRDEGGLLRSLNADRAALARLCQRLAGVDVADPCAVGINPQGLDVRARFGIVRAEFPVPVGSAAQVAEMLRSLREDSAGAGP